MASRNIKRGPLIKLAIAVCAMGALVGGCFGANAGSGYRIFLTVAGGQEAPSLSNVGLLLGLLFGLLSGLLWCRILVPLAMREPSRRLTGRSVLAGIAVGILATIPLHLCLMVASARQTPDVLIIGPMCAVPAGAITGLICGPLCRWAVRSALGEESPAIPEVPA